MSPKKTHIPSSATHADISSVAAHRPDTRSGHSDVTSAATDPRSSHAPPPQQPPATSNASAAPVASDASATPLTPSDVHDLSDNHASTNSPTETHSPAAIANRAGLVGANTNAPDRSRPTQGGQGKLPRNVNRTPASHPNNSSNNLAHIHTGTTLDGSTHNRHGHGRAGNGDPLTHRDRIRDRGDYASSGNQLHQVNHPNDHIDAAHHRLPPTMVANNATEIRFLPEEPTLRPVHDYVARSPIVEMVGVGPCVHRLIRLNEEQRRRTLANSLDDFWRPFVQEYFAPSAKLMLDVYSDIAMAPRSIELPCDVIARIFKTKFDSGIVEEKLLMENPCEFLLRNGIVVVDCPRAIVMTIYQDSKVCTEGHLRVSFSDKMKILCWEFSTKHHEELVNRNTVPLPVQATNELGISQTVSRVMKIAEALNELRPRISKAAREMDDRSGQQTAQSTGTDGLRTDRPPPDFGNYRGHDERNSATWFDDVQKQDMFGDQSNKRRKTS